MRDDTFFEYIAEGNHIEPYESDLTLETVQKDFNITADFVEQMKIQQRKEVMLIHEAENSDSPIFYTEEEVYTNLATSVCSKRRRQ